MPAILKSQGVPEVLERRNKRYNQAGIGADIEVHVASCAEVF